MFNRKKKGQLGFTLIELLAVVAILGILAGVAVPRVMGALANARAGANTANIAILQSAVERWGIDNNPGNTQEGWRGLLTTSDGGTELLTGPISIHHILRTALGPYIANFPTVPAGFRPYVIDIVNLGATTSPNFVTTVRNLP